MTNTIEVNKPTRVIEVYKTGPQGPKGISGTDVVVVNALPETPNPTTLYVVIPE